jgi:hypothetical protein
MSATATPVDKRASEIVNKVAIGTLSLGTHERVGESSPVLGTPTEVMQHIGELTVWSEGPRNIILARGCSNGYPTRTIERIEIGEEEMILNSQFLLPELSFIITGYSAVTLGADESKGLLIGGDFLLDENSKWESQKTIEFELSTKNWDINHPMTKHMRRNSSASVLPDGSPAICGGFEMPPQKSTEIRGEDGEWNLSETAILHLGRCYHRTAVVNSSMFAIGGTTKNGPTNTVDMWDPRDKSGWKNDSSIPPMIGKRSSLSVSSVDDSIFVFGGYSGDFLNSCESLDIRSNKWKSISSMPSNRSDHSSIIIGNQIIIIGGLQQTTQIDSYNPTTNTWTTLQHKLLQSRWAFRAFAL